METYTVAVNMQVEVTAFSKQDAIELVAEYFEDVPDFRIIEAQITGVADAT